MSARISLDRFEFADNNHFRMREIIGDTHSILAQVYCADCGSVVTIRLFPKKSDDTRWQGRIWHGRKINSEIYDDVTLMTYVEGPRGVFK